MIENIHGLHPCIYMDDMPKYDGTIVIGWVITFLVVFSIIIFIFFFEQFPVIAHSHLFYIDWIILPGKDFGTKWVII